MGSGAPDGRGDLGGHGGGLQLHVHVGGHRVLEEEGGAALPGVRGPLAGGPPPPWGAGGLGSSPCQWLKGTSPQLV